MAYNNLNEREPQLQYSGGSNSNISMQSTVQFALDVNHQDALLQENLRKIEIQMRILQEGLNGYGKDSIFGGVKRYFKDNKNRKALAEMAGKIIEYVEDAKSNKADAISVDVALKEFCRWYRICYNGKFSSDLPTVRTFSKNSDIIANQASTVKYEYSKLKKDVSVLQDKTQETQKALQAQKNMFLEVIQYNNMKLPPQLQGTLNSSLSDNEEKEVEHVITDRKRQNDNLINNSALSDISSDKSNSPFKEKKIQNNSYYKSPSSPNFHNHNGQQNQHHAANGMDNYYLNNYPTGMRTSLY